MKYGRWLAEVKKLIYLDLSRTLAISLNLGFFLL